MECLYDLNCGTLQPNSSISKKIIMKHITRMPSAFLFTVLDRRNNTIPLLSGDPNNICNSDARVSLPYILVHTEKIQFHHELVSRSIKRDTMKTQVAGGGFRQEPRKLLTALCYSRSAKNFLLALPQSNAVTTPPA